MTPAPAVPSPPGPDVSHPLLAVLDALLREDVVGLRTRTTPVERPDGTWLRLPIPSGGALLLPVRSAVPGFQCATETRLPLLRQEPSGARAPADGRELTTPRAVLTALAALADPRDRAGFDHFATECEEAFAAHRLHRATRADHAARLVARHGPDPARWTGLAAGLALDSLAARQDHPVHPTGRGRAGLTEADLRAYAPEFHPTFRLRLLAVDRDRLVRQGGYHDEVFARGLTGGRHGDGEGDGDRAPDRDDVLLPVHPLTADGPLREALRATGLDRHAALLDTPGPDVVPTLSLRTVALADDPRTHLKLPLATATLGRLNRRTITPGSLVDGAAGQRLLEQVIAREPRFRDTVLHADETRYAHAGHELLAALVRRMPDGLDHTTVVPLAALLSRAPDGRPLIEPLADRFFGGAPLALLDAVLTLVLDWGTTLLGYGIALESHQQNVSLLLDRPDGRTRLRLLLKDNDGPRVHPPRLRATLGGDGPRFADSRVATADERAVLDLFTTITVHLCAGAYAFGLARHGHAPLTTLLGLVRDRLTDAAERLGTRPGEPGALLRTHVLDAPHLPVKAMVTAGTLLTKERSGALDINKHYGTGPNYLAWER
ncbi:IucA/IucC family protein [Streptomyces sp. NPDC057638]|uniref:IucA/IucC family protein n=1 Tax=Streptomyces sp. NPDC057638 TaxID=3346190 RepID=UPI0036C91CBC